jgi:NADH-quinone oxidoreductase subunit G
MLQRALKAYVLLGGVEPWADAMDADSIRTLGKAEFVVAITPFASDQLRKVAHVMLPMGSFLETSGTYVNLEGVWQSQAGAALPVGEARPGWKILRVLGNLLNLSGFEYQSSEDVREELRALAGAVLSMPAYGYKGTYRASTSQAAGPVGVLDLPMYEIDAVVRRAPALQKTTEGRATAVTY